jgi:hypothetical protein
LVVRLRFDTRLFLTFSLIHTLDQSAILWPDSSIG